MRKSPFSRLFEDIDNELMTLLGTHLHKRKYEEFELREVLNNTIGTITSRYNSYVDTNYPVETSVAALITGMSNCGRNKFYVSEFFDEESGVYKEYLKPMIEKLDNSKQNEWNSFIESMKSKDSLEYPGEFKEMLKSMAELMPDSPKNALDNKAAMKEVIDILIPDDPKEANKTLRDIRSNNSKNTKDYILEAFMKTKTMESKDNLTKYAKEIESLTKSKDGRARSIAQTPKDEITAVSYFATLQVVKNEKRLTIEESLKKINEMTRGAISRFGSYSFENDGLKLTTKDFFGLGTQVNKFEDKIAQAKLTSEATPNKKKEPQKEYKDHKEKVLDLLQTGMDKAVGLAKSKDAKVYVRDLYESFIDAANKLPELTTQNLMLADLEDSTVLEMVKEYIGTLSVEEIEESSGHFDRLPDELVTDNVRELRVFMMETSIKRKENGRGEEQQRTNEED
ncbi:MAG: hypothetical protein Q4B60_05270 [Erysipelotrichaceae bacterium]|nr:hypothetical protein [Erysipelotrichaceae bacterium]